MVLNHFIVGLTSYAAKGGKKCIDFVFLRHMPLAVRKRPNKTVLNRFIKNQYKGKPPFHSHTNNEKVPSRRMVLWEETRYRVVLVPAFLSSMSHAPSMYMMPSARSYRP